MSIAHHSGSPFLLALRILVVAVVVLVFPAPAFAGNCKWISSPSTVAFGTYSVFSPAAITAPTQFAFRCTPNQYARLTLSTGSSGSFVPFRTMTSGAQVAAYNLFLDAGASQIWGDTSSGTVAYDVYNSTPADKDFLDFIYGVIPAGADLAVGTYTDIVIATLGYSNNPNGPWNTIAPVTMTVSVVVVPECRVDSFNLDFGTYSPFVAAALPQSTLLKVYCTKNSAPTSVTLNNGSFPLGAQKRMTSSAGTFLLYNATLGSTSGSSTSSVVPIANGFALNGSVPAQQDVELGGYTDTLVATVNY